MAKFYGKFGNELTFENFTNSSKRVQTCKQWNIFWKVCPPPKLLHEKDNRENFWKIWTSVQSLEQWQNFSLVGSAAIFKSTFGNELAFEKFAKSSKRVSTHEPSWKYCTAFRITKQKCTKMATDLTSGNINQCPKPLALAQILKNQLYIYTNSQKSAS